MAIGIISLGIELEACVEGAVDCCHPLFNAGGGFAGAHEGEVKKVEVHCAGAVESILDDSQRFGLISAGDGDLVGVVARLEKKQGQLFGHCGAAAVE